jgi:hypothetical protein
VADTLNLAIADARSLLNEPSGVGSATDHELAKWGNEAQRFLATAIQASDANFFEESDQSLGFIADQEEYDLPAVCRDRIITKMTRTDLSERVPIDPIPFQQRDIYQQSGLLYTGSNGEGRYYYLRGNKLGLKPTPKTTVSANILIHYLQLPHDLHYGVLGASSDSNVTTTTFKMPTSTSSSANPYLKAGRLSTKPNYYVNARIRIITGSALGTERKITAFNVATQFATIDSAWTVADVENKEYVILSPLRDEYKSAMFHYMVMMAGIKKKNPELIAMGSGEWNRVYEDLLETAKIRSLDGNQYVQPPADFDLG